MKTKVNQHIFSLCDMTNSSLDNVNELLRLDYGDKYRLEDIKRRLDNGQVLYNSDNNYLQQLVNLYDGEIHKKIGSTYLKQTLEPSLTKKKSNKKKKREITLGVTILLFLVISYYTFGGFSP
jgi:hypothetical protein